MKPWNGQSARDHGIAFEDDDYFFTEYRWQQLQKAKAKDNSETTFLSETPDQWFSTVGAVALDSQGNLAAGTSTGGIIALDPQGNIALTFNTAGMYRASVDIYGKVTVAIYKDEQSGIQPLP